MVPKKKRKPSESDELKEAKVSKEENEEKDESAEEKPLENGQEEECKNKDKFVFSTVEQAK